LVKKLKRGVKFGREKKPLPEDFDLWYPRWRRRETTFTWTAGFSRRTIRVGGAGKLQEKRWKCTVGYISPQFINGRGRGDFLIFL
jgi:hypothetical protein